MDEENKGESSSELKLSNEDSETNEAQLSNEEISTPPLVSSESDTTSSQINPTRKASSSSIGESSKIQGDKETSPHGRYVKANRLLGSGAYKDVFQAHDTHEGTFVAWNVVKLNRIPPNERKRIRNEVKLLKALNHPHIIKYLSSWVNREKEEVVFVTEIMSSGALKEYLSRNLIISWGVAKRWCKEILSGLGFYFFLLFLCSS